MDYESAKAEADELTREAAQRGETDGYWIEVQQAPGDWIVEKRTMKRGFLRRIWDAFWDTPS